MATAFTPILERAVHGVPGAIGAIFADWDGEAVDAFCPGSRDEMLLLGAYYGVILNHVQSALHLSHFGEAEEIIVQHERIDFIVRPVDRHYYVVVAIESGGQLAVARRETIVAARALRAEM
jgi:predicted regulator of Ras-like GTPase activity (Roadblock/LC7/MglB family)